MSEIDTAGVPLGVRLFFLATSTSKVIGIYLCLNIWHQSSTLPETNSLHLKWMVGILVSFWDGQFSGAMLVSGRVNSLFCPSKWMFWGVVGGRQQLFESHTHTHTHIVSILSPRMPMESESVERVAST